MQWNGASHCEYDRKLMETETTTWSVFPTGGKAIVEQILASEEINKCKRAGLQESQSGIRVGKLTIGPRSFFLWGFSFMEIGDSQDSRGREETRFYSTLPLPPAHEHSDIYVELCMWDGYLIFLTAPLVFTTLLLDEIYHLTELQFDWLMWR